MTSNAMPKHLVLDTKPDFKLWVAQVDEIVYGKYGLSIHDLPDTNMRDAFEGGTTPEDFCREDLVQTLEDEGFPVF